MTMPTYHITIADKIKAYRNENNLSLKDFSKLIGVSAQAVCKWEQNTCYPDIMLLPHLARILECQTDAFFVLVYPFQKGVEKHSTNGSLTENDTCDILKTNPNGGDNRK